MTNDYTQIIEEARLSAIANIQLCRKEVIGRLGEKDSQMPRIYIDSAKDKVERLFEDIASLITEYENTVSKNKEAEVALKSTGALQNEVAEYKKRIENANAMLTKSRDDHNETTRAYENMRVENIQLERQLQSARNELEKQAPQIKELAALRKLNPVGLGQQLERVTKAKDKQIDKLKGQLQDKEYQLSQMNSAVTAAKHAMDEKFGKNLEDRYLGKEGVIFRLKKFNYGAEFRVVPEYDISPIINDMPWSLRVYSSFGVGIDVAVNEFLVPIFPMCSEVADVWPEKLSDVIQQHILDEVKSSEPDRLKARKVAKSYTLTTNDAFTENQKSALKKAKMITMFEVGSISYEALMAKLTATKLVDRKGAEAIYKVCQALYAESITPLTKMLEAA
ncbi:hypothetical protein [Vibrio mediterranei]|uniref:hypothetical protein n=1 Tax=Vibrio mediterranei TaxID=689 RepID=UPI004067D5A7